MNPRKRSISRCPHAFEWPLCRTLLSEVGNLSDLTQVPGCVVFGLASSTVSGSNAHVTLTEYSFHSHAGKREQHERPEGRNRRCPKVMPSRLGPRDYDQFVQVAVKAVSAHRKTTAVSPRSAQYGSLTWLALGIPGLHVATSQLVVICIHSLHIVNCGDLDMSLIIGLCLWICHGVYMSAYDRLTMMLTRMHEYLSDLSGQPGPIPFLKAAAIWI